MQTRVNVALAERSYEIVIEAGLLGRFAETLAPVLRSPRMIIVSDEHVSAAYGAQVVAECVAHGIHAEMITLPAGEATKSFTHFSDLLERLLALAPDRRTTLVALGGGVIGDITGFAASVLLRGVDFVQMPTTLLAQVDSSVGGKTGINSTKGKNLVGSFYQPRIVLIDTDALTTLPKREMQSGYSEILKYGLIGDVEFYRWLLRHGPEILAGDSELLSRAIARCCEMKAYIVGGDEREEGNRAVLNFGHTFGHAIEAELKYDGRVLHGEAVALGMVMACNLSARLGLIDAAVERELADHLHSVGMKSHVRELDASFNTERLLHHMQSDKKTENGALTFIVLDTIGHAKARKNVPETLVRDVLEHYLQEGA
jgi:3-dehydroquinate synthase